MFNKKAIKGTTLALALSGIMSFTSLPTYAVLGEQTLKKGMSHEDVQVLQEELKSFGLFSNVNTTTYYGDITEESVKAFQLSQGLEINGIFDITTYQKLMALKATTISSEDKVKSVSIAPSVNSSSKGALIYNRQLKLEDKGSDVKQLQEALKGLGFLTIDNTTEYFGTQTQEALKAFQQSQELIPDGIAGLRTFESINRVLAGKGIALPEVSRSAERSRAANIIETGKKYLGVRYVFGGTSPKGFDCSGFTSYVFKQNGITLPRATDGQATVGTKVSKSDLQAGDLVIFSNTYKRGPSHVGIYIGNDQFIHASSTRSGGVIISDINSSYYTNHFSYGRRVL
ncbi:peptidase [Tissierella creatinini]|nr:peptidase [Tissierella creatinini]TJX67506.1 peptidase [Soehngenia saccharolytica]